jgi:hypothetical protein
MSENSKETSTEKEQEDSVTVKKEDKSKGKSEDKSESKPEDKSKDKSSNSENSDEEVYFSTKYSIPKLNFNLKTIQPHITNEKMGVFDSEDIELKKNIRYESNSLQKSEIKKINEAISTDRGTERDSVIKIRNNKSHRKRYSVFKLIEKDKRYKRDLNSVFLDQKKINETNETAIKKERTDIYGNVINKKNKRKVKVSFVDKVYNKPLVNVIEIKSYKNFNYIEGMPKEREVNKADTRCVCCSIF